LSRTVPSARMPAMEIAAIFFSSLVVGFSGALMPGPVLTVTIAHAIRRGPMAGPLVSLGHGAVEATLVVALTLGLSQVIQLPLVTGLIGILGGVCLLYMGSGMIHAQAPSELSSGKPSAEGSIGPVTAGALTSVSNPLLGNMVGHSWRGPTHPGLQVWHPGRGGLRSGPSDGRLQLVHHRGGGSGCRTQAPHPGGLSGHLRRLRCLPAAVGALLPGLGGPTRSAKSSGQLSASFCVP